MTLSEPFFDRSWQSHQVTYHKSLQIAIVTKIGLKHNTFFKVLRGFRGRWVPSRMFSKAWDGNNNRVQVLARERERERERVQRLTATDIVQLILPFWPFSVAIDVLRDRQPVKESSIRSFFDDPTLCNTSPRHALPPIDSCCQININIIRLVLFGLERPSFQG